jgi:hypothetical protein
VVTANLINRSRPGFPYAVGDTFELQISGPANSPVSISATQNNQSLGTSSYGYTDSSGRRNISARWEAGNNGNWDEVIQVGAGTPARLSFQVYSSPVAGTVTAAPVVAAPVSVYSPAPASGGPLPSPAPGALPLEPIEPWYLNKTVLIGAAAAAAAFFFMGGRR